jgi:hypothetical protein
VVRGGGGGGRPGSVCAFMFGGDGHSQVA